jgi:hypothetical protein
MSQARLTEPGIKAWISHVLRSQREKQDKVTNAWFNLVMLATLVFTLGAGLSYRYRTSKDPAIRERQEQQRKQYIIDKLQRLAAVQSRNGMITTLPTFDTFVGA